MDTTKPSFSLSDFSLSPAELTRQLQSGAAPLVVDVRKNAAFLASPFTLPGALRRDPFQLESWADALPAASAVLVYCVHGHEVSQTTMAALRQRGINALFLIGGMSAWCDQGYAVVPAQTDAADDQEGRTA